MAAIKTEMPPLHTADGGGGSGSGNANGGNGGVSSAEGGGSGGGSASNSATTTTNAVVSSGPHSNSSGVADSGSATNGTHSVSNNTISAAADSSDNQPGTPQPTTNNSNSSNNAQLMSNNNEQQQQQQQHQMSHMPYGMYPSAAAASANGAMPHMYSGAGGMYASASEMQQQQQQQQHQQYPSYLNSYEQFYHQQQQQQIGQSADYTQTAGLMYGAANSGDYKINSSVRYQPYHTRPPTAGGASSDARSSDINRNGTPDGASSASGGGGGGASSLSSLTQSSAAVSTTTNSLSPRVVSSSSPTSTSAHMQMSGGSAAGSPGGGCKLQCKKCGLMCTSDNELQEHITNIHGASPYGSSGYSSSPYIKEELSTGSQQQGQQGQGGGGGNPGELLDLDSQKMVYPPAPGSIQSLLGHPQQMHDPVGASDPLHSMHSMQQRALPGWETAQPPPNGGMQDALPSYMHTPQTQTPHVADMNGKAGHGNTAAYYSTTGDNTGVSIKQEYGLIKTEYPDSQNYVDKSFDPTVAGDMCQQQAAVAMQQQQTTMMPVSSSPAEFPSTTTGPQDPQQQYRGFEPPTSSSVNTGSLPTKAATWKSNEARRPKTYNCTACNKWFTSSGHLKRHYNTTLHKNAVKSSGQPDPATLPISAHHHPARDPSVSTKPNSRRNNNAAAVAAAAAATAAAAAVAQQNQAGGTASVQTPPEPTRSPQEFVPTAGMGPMSQYSASPSPTHQAQMNGMAYGANPSGYATHQQQQRPYMNQVQSASASSSSSSPQHMSASSNAQTVLNGHPNGLAGPSAQVTHLPTIPSSRTRGLLNTTTTTTININNTTTKSEPMEDNYQPNNSNSTNKRHRLNSSEQLELESSMSPTQLERSQTDMEVLEQQQQQQHQLLDEEAADAAAVALQAELQQRHRLVQAQQEQAELEEQERQELEQQHRGLESYHQHHLMVESLEEVEEQQRPYHSSNTPMLNQAASAHIISRQQYREPVRRPLPMVDSIFSPMHQQMAAAHMQANIMDQAYNLIPLGISNNMLQLQPPPHITTTTHTHNTATTLNMGNIHMQPPPLRLLSPHSSNHQHQHNQQQAQHHQDRLPLPSMRNMPLLNNTNIQSPQQLVDPTTIPHNTITTTTTLQPLPPPITTTTTTIQLQQQPPPQQLQQQQHTINTIQSYQQLQQQASELGQQLEPTLTYHTIIGNQASAAAAAAAAQATSGVENAESSAFNTSHAISVSSNSNNSDNSSDSSEVLQLTALDPYGEYQTAQQMVTADGQILQFMPSALMGQPFIALSAAPPPPFLLPSSSSSTSRITLREAYARSPQEGDLPPVHTIMSHGSNPEYHGFESSQSMSGAYADAMDLYPHTATTAETTILTKEEPDINGDTSTTIEARNLTSQVSATESSMAEGARKKTTLIKRDSNESTSITKSNPNAGTKSRRKSTTTGAGGATKARTIAKPSRPPAERRTVTRCSRQPIVRSTDPEIKELPGGRLKCMECDKEFSKACYVTQHKASFHRGEYPYRCSKCGKRYQDESKYRIHYERHFTPNKPHKCVLCPKQFHYKTDLRRHIEAKHNEVLPHGCTHCPKGFCRQDHLRKHVDTHNMEHKKAKDLVKRSTIRRVQLEYRTAGPTANGITKTQIQNDHTHREDVYVEDDEDIYDDDEDGADEHMDYTELDVDEGVVVEDVDMDIDMKVTDDGVIYKIETVDETPHTSQGGAELYDSCQSRRMTRLESMESLQNLTMTAVAMPLRHNNGMLLPMNDMIIEDRYAHNDDDDEEDGVEEVQDVQEVDGYVIIKKEEKQLSAYF